MPRSPGGPTAIGRSVDGDAGRGHAVGTPAQFVDLLGTWAEIGVDRFYLQILDLADLDHIELLGGRKVRPQVAMTVAEPRLWPARPSTVRWC